jgi:hypothetical protein
MTVLVAAGGSELRPARLAAPGLSVVGINADVGRFYTEHIAQQLKLLGLEVVTMREIESLLGMERQRELLGCTNEASSCIAELANALGTDGVLLGDIGRLGMRYTINLKIVAGDNGRTLAVFSGTATSDDEVVDTLTKAARSLATDATRALGRAPPRPPAVQASGISLRKLAVIPAAIGVISLGTGIGLLAWSNADYNALKTGAPLSQGQTLAARGPTTAAIGVAAVVVSGLGLAAAALMFALGAPDVPVSVGVSPAGAALFFHGAWP